MNIRFIYLLFKNETRHYKHQITVSSYNTSEKYQCKKLSRLKQEGTMNRSSTIYNQNSPNQFQRNMLVDFNVRGQQRIEFDEQVI